MSADYAHITVAVDLTPESSKVIEKAQRIAARTHAALDVLHTLEPVGFTYGADSAVDADSLQRELEAHARQALDRLATPLGIAAQHQHILVGQADTLISEFTQSHASDLIVVGSHGRTGLALLLGSTSASILRHADCDVLAVRVSERASEPID